MEDNKQKKPKRFYYILSQDDKKFGPFEDEEVLHLLKYEKISNETLVWFEGLSQWVKLGTIPELKLHKVAVKRTSAGLYLRVNIGRFFIPGVLLIGLYFYFVFVMPPKASSKLHSQIFPKDPPKQELNISLKPFQLRVPNGSIRISSLAKYSISGRVLSTSRYYLDWKSNIAEVDVALGWGELAKVGSDEHITYRQSRRWYFFDYSKDSKIDGNYIIEHSSNHHLIPATENIRRAIHSLEKNDIVRLKGYLVKASGTYKGDPVSWRSSVSRRDTGNGACELMYVISVAVDGLVYN
jgi:hypothetical protein